MPRKKVETQTKYTTNLEDFTQISDSDISKWYIRGGFDLTDVLNKVNDLIVDNTVKVLLPFDVIKIGNDLVVINGNTRLAALKTIAAKVDPKLLLSELVNLDNQEIEDYVALLEKAYDLEIQPIPYNIIEDVENADAVDVQKILSVQTLMNDTTDEHKTFAKVEAIAKYLDYLDELDEQDKDKKAMVTFNLNRSNFYRYKSLITVDPVFRTLYELGVVGVKALQMLQQASNSTLTSDMLAVGLYYIKSDPALLTKTVLNNANFEKLDFSDCRFSQKFVETGIRTIKNIMEEDDTSTITEFEESVESEDNTVDPITDIINPATPEELAEVTNRLECLANDARFQTIPSYPVNMVSNLISLIPFLENEETREALGSFLDVIAKNLNAKALSSDRVAKILNKSDKINVLLYADETKTKTKTKVDIENIETEKEEAELI